MQYGPLERIKFPIRDFIMRHARGPQATSMLALIAAVEATISPLPVEAALGPFVVVQPHRWLYYAAVATLASVAGALIGYAIGLTLYDTIAAPVIAWYGLESDVARTATLLRENMFLATFLAAFTPAPYKVFVFLAGLLNGPLFIFLLASLLGRGARFVIFAYLSYHFGGAVARLVFRYFTLATVLLAVIALGILAVVVL